MVKQAFILSAILLSAPLYGQKLFKVPKDVIWAINAAYKPMQGPLAYGESYYRLVDLASDDITYSETIGNDANTDNLNFGDNNESSNVYNAFITGVQRANLVLDNTNSVSMDPKMKQRIIAEAKFLRAFYYWHLTSIFGDVPLYLKFPGSESEMFIPKSSKEVIYTQMIKDLKEAENVLPERYTGNNVGRATKYAVKSLLGKVYLFQENWADAAAKFEEVAKSGQYSLMDNFKDNFNEANENNTESVFELQHIDIVQTNNLAGIYFTEGDISGEGDFRPIVMRMKDARMEIGYSQIIATNDLFNEFEPGDPRLTQTFWLVGDTTLKGIKDNIIQNFTYTVSHAKSVRIGDVTIGKYFHIKKCVPGFTSYAGDSPINWRIIRYADVLLMYAEALAESGNIKEAIVQLNKIRSRARGINKNILPDFPYSSTYGGNKPYLTVNEPSGTIPFYAGVSVTFNSTLEDFRNALVHERRVELATEYHRYFDLVRWDKISGHPGAASKVFSQKQNAEDKKNYISNIHQRFPFSKATIDASKNTLMQNPGY